MKQRLSAQVILRSASGRGALGATITAANIADYLPAPESASRAAALLEQLGFEVGDQAANSFPIIAPARVFEKIFRVRVHQTANGGVQASPKGAKQSSYELPLDALPSELQQLVEAVTFTAPPDFGPTSP